MLLNYTKWSWFLLVIGIVFSLLIFEGPLRDLSQNYDDPFLVMAILNENNETKSYFPNEGDLIPLNETIKWHIYLHNQPTTSVNVNIKTKIIGEIGKLPDSIHCIPSPCPEIFNIEKKIDEKSTKIIPFYWKVTQILHNETHKIIKSIEINGEAINCEITTSINGDFQIIFELWVHEPDTNLFVFKWKSREESQCIWNYIRFKV